VTEQIIQPADLGLPPKFEMWRPGQLEAALDALSSERRFVGHSIPTGSGKSLDYVAQALISGYRTAILTSTKGLQDQLVRDFEAIGLTDVRGRNNYICVMGSDLSCEQGHDIGCSQDRDRKTGTCPYQLAYRKACAAQIVVTNYAYWMAIHQYGDGLGKFDMLVLDEGHDAPDEVCNAVACEISTREAFQMLGSGFPDREAEFDSWKSWAQAYSGMARLELDSLVEELRTSASKSTMHELQRWRALSRKLDTLASAVGPWAVEESRHGYKFDPLWPSQYAERLLFRGIPRVLIVSATLMPKTLQLLGIEPADYDFREYPSMFQPAYSPVYFVATAKIGEKSGAEEYARWHDRIDEIAGSRLDRKGIIHTVSYDRRDKIMLASQYSEHMIGHDPKGTRDTVHFFKQTTPPAILVSPSMGTGWDFPDAECRWQIIAKIPFPDRRPVVVRMREKEDPHYGPYLAVQSLVQSTGRGRRSAKDWCENFIIDDNFRWIYHLYRSYFPAWWRRLYRRPKEVPAPLRIPV